MLLTLIIVFRRVWRRDPVSSVPRTILVYLAIVITGGLIFCLMLSWQPWITRYQLNFFLLMAPAVAAVLVASIGRRWLVGGSIILLLAALPSVFDNETRPLMSLISARTGTIPKPWDVIFRVRPGVYAAYRDAVMAIAGRTFGGVGLVINHDSWEFPLWLMLNDTRSQTPVRIEHICLWERDKPIAAFRPEVLLLVDRPAPQTLTCAQGVFEKEASFAAIGDHSGDVHVYHRLTRGGIAE